MVKRAAIFALQPHNCLRLHREWCLDQTARRASGGRTLRWSPCPRRRPFALFLWPEVRIDLHPDEKRAWILQIDISRVTQKLYVRRNTHKPWPDGGEVFDATIEVPVTIRNPDKPIGTHVFTAMARNNDYRDRRCREKRRSL